MDKSRQYFKTWHLTHEDHCLAGDRISKLLDKMKTDGGMESVSLLAELCTLQPAPAEKRRWCEIVPLGENSLQFCTYWRDADIFSTEYFTSIHSPLLVDWLMYQWSLCTERWQRDKQRILFIWLCSAATQFFITSKATMFEALLLWRSCDTFTIFLVNSALSRLRASRFYLFIYLTSTKSTAWATIIWLPFIQSFE